jgi:hypothetical protein
MSLVLSIYWVEDRSDLEWSSLKFLALSQACEPQASHRPLLGFLHQEQARHCRPTPEWIRRNRDVNPRIHVEIHVHREKTIYMEFARPIAEIHIGASFDTHGSQKLIEQECWRSKFELSWACRRLWIASPDRFCLKWAIHDSSKVVRIWDSYDLRSKSNIDGANRQSERTLWVCSGIVRQAVKEMGESLSPLTMIMTPKFEAQSKLNKISITILTKSMHVVLAADQTFNRSYYPCRARLLWPNSTLTSVFLT